MSRLHSLEVTKLDRKRGIKLPRIISTELAYFCGILAGDGHIAYNRSKGRYLIKCIGNPSDEKPFYIDVVVPMIKKLFGMSVSAKLYDNGTTYGFLILSKTLVEFLCFTLGMPHGNKSGIIKINKCFLKSEALTVSFIRGFADTDFCLTLKKRYKTVHYYPVIVGVSKSKNIIETDM